MDDASTREVYEYQQKFKLSKDFFEARTQVEWIQHLEDFNHHLLQTCLSEASEMDYVPITNRDTAIIKYFLDKKLAEFESIYIYIML